MIIIQVFLWFLWLILSLFLGVLGLIFIPIALKLNLPLTRESQTIPGKQILSWPSWMWLWGNEEDGLDPEWYQNANPSWSKFRRIFTWSAIRNSVNNLQRVKYLNAPPLTGCGQLKSIQGKYGNFNWIGPYAGGQLFLFGKQFNYGYGFIPWESEAPKGMPENDTRDIPYISQHWS